jgi:hypothetical protein
LLGISVKTRSRPSGRISVAANSDEARQANRRVEHLNRLAASQSDHRAAVCVSRDTGIGRGEPGPMQGDCCLGSPAASAIFAKWAGSHPPSELIAGTSQCWARLPVQPSVVQRPTSSLEYPIYAEASD